MRGDAPNDCGCVLAAAPTLARKQKTDAILGANSATSW